MNLRSASGTFSALRERDFAWYFTGNVCFFLAMQMNQLLRGYLAYELTDAALALGLIAMTIALPMLLVAPIGGVISDRYNKRTLLVVVQLFTALVNAVLSVLIYADLIEYWHLLVSTLCLGIAIAIAMPARQAMVPSLVPQHRMMNAISLQMGSMNLTRIVGPAVGGLLIAPLGIGNVWTIGVVLYFVSVLTVLPLPKHGMVSTVQSFGFREDLLGGFRYLAGQPTLRILMITGMVMPLFAFPVQMVLPVFAEDVFEQGPAALGVLMAAAGVGGLIGALISANLDHVPSKSGIMLVGTFIMSVSYVFFAQSTSIGLTGNSAFALGLLMFGIGNIGGMLFQTTNNATIQAIVSDELRGRVMSLLMMSFGIMPLGILPLTIAVDAFGAPNTVAVSSIVMLLALLAFFALSPRLRNLRLEALAHAELSPSQAAALVAEGKLSPEDAERLTGRAAGRATEAPPDAQPAPTATTVLAPRDRSVPPAGPVAPARRTID
jgi:MFS family permease